MGEASAANWKQPWARANPLSVADEAGKPRVAKLYHTVRSAHVERNATTSPAWILYTRHSYDFDPELNVQSSYLNRVSMWTAERTIRSLGIRRVEINEPFMVATWPLIAVFLFQRARRRHRMGTSIVVYAIANHAPQDAISAKFKIPHSVSRIIARCFVSLVLKRSSRICFGTGAAHTAYRDLLGEEWEPIEKRSRVIEMLPASAGDCRKNGGSFLFLGELSGRKGLDRILAAWPRVRREVKGSVLLVVGAGPLESDVVERAKVDDSIQFFGLAHREDVREILSKAQVVVMPSRASPGWREQVGLPLLEGWAHGCELVTTADTGIAESLRTNGHQVLPQDYSDRQLSDAMIAASRSDRNASDIQSQLPETDGRAMAEQWLHSGA